jgi:hypothetical protein
VNGKRNPRAGSAAEGERRHEATETEDPSRETCRHHPAGTIATRAVEVVPRPAADDSSPKALLYPDRLAEKLLRRLRLAGAEVERAELVKRPRLSAVISKRLGQTTRTTQQTEEVEPAERERQQSVQRPREAKLLFEAAGTVEPLEQSEQAVGLAQEDVPVEQVACGRRAEQLVRLLDPVRHPRRRLVELLDDSDQRTLVLVFLRKCAVQRPCVLGFALGFEVRERVGVGADLERVRAHVNHAADTSAHGALLVLAAAAALVSARRSSAGQSSRP